MCVKKYWCSNILVETSKFKHYHVFEWCVNCGYEINYNELSFLIERKYYIFLSWLVKKYVNCRKYFKKIAFLIYGYEFLKWYLQNIKINKNEIKSINLFGILNFEKAIEYVKIYFLHGYKTINKYFKGYKKN